MGDARDRWIMELEESNILFDNLRAVARRSHAQQMEDLATLERDHQRKIRARMDLEEAREDRPEEERPGPGAQAVPGVYSQAQAEGRSRPTPDYLSDRSAE